MPRKAKAETEKKEKKPRGKKAAKKEEEEEEPNKGEEIKEIKVAEPKGKGKKRARDEAGDDSDDGEAKPKIPAIAPEDFSLPNKESGQIKIVSWNVAGFKAILGKGFVEYLAAEDPDIICLQETKIKEEVALKLKLPAHYHAYFNECTSDSGSGYAGTGLLSKIKPVKVTKGIGAKEHDEEGRVLTAEYETFYLVTSYVPNSGRGLTNLDYRVQQWDVAFLAYLKELEKTKPVIWCGDLNVAHQEIDLKNPKTNKKTAGFTPVERESFSKLLATGFVDSYRHFYPTQEGAYTFWSYVGGARAKDVGWRLDYFIVSQSFMPSVAATTIRKTVMGSDHCPIVLMVKA